MSHEKNVVCEREKFTLREKWRKKIKKKKSISRCEEIQEIENKKKEKKKRSIYIFTCRYFFFLFFNFKNASICVLDEKKKVKWHEKLFFLIYQHLERKIRDVLNCHSNKKRRKNKKREKSLKTYVVCIHSISIIHGIYRLCIKKKSFLFMERENHAAKKIPFFFIF